MIPIGLIAIDFAFLCSRHIIPPQAVSRITQTTSRHLPDTFQTPSRRPTDTPSMAHYYQSKATRRQEPSYYKLVYWVFINCLHIIPPRQYPESLRQPPDTSQTLSRQPSDIPRHLGEEEPADQNYSYWIYVNQYHITPSPDINTFGVVWNVSKRCLEGVWITLDTAWMVTIPN